ncbi:S8 family serine peptidase [Streptomyces sp. NPDC052101]|uniref:S53 family peptidase n=1 Tax=Streptomyces sp. NPDC052101 TaxID=3155763 RepID=UPI003417AFB5
MVRTDVPARRALQPGQQPGGFGPRDIHLAYHLPPTGAGRTVAITIPFHDPNLESDLAVYHRQFNLPTCTKANGCLRVINQRGGTDLPTATDRTWALEESLDVDAVSAACQHCRILVVEADDNNLGNLFQATLQGAAEGAKFVSNSWTVPEFPGETYGDTLLRNLPGVVFAFASGNAGGQTFYPSASPYVTSVGGTTLPRDSMGHLLPETAWAGSGSGCSAFEPKPSFQHDTFCPNSRTTADVSAVADDATGLAVYDTYPPPNNATGWLVLGGTSLSTALVAGMYALAGNPAPGTFPNSYPYARPQNFNDIVTGCAGTFCAGPGYDPPTGIGTPHGVRGLRLGGHHNWDAPARWPFTASGGGAASGLVPATCAAMDIRCLGALAARYFSHRS